MVELANNLCIPRKDKHHQPQKVKLEEKIMSIGSIAMKHLWKLRKCIVLNYLEFLIGPICQNIFVF